MSWRNRIFRFIDRTGHWLGQWGVSFSSVHLLNCYKPPAMSDREIDSSLIFENLDPQDIPQMAEHRDEATIRARLEKGYICRVAKAGDGVIEQVLWFTNRPYYCWPIRTIIDPGPHGWYLYDGYTMAHARLKHRYSQHFAAWYNMQPPETAPIVGMISGWNDPSLRGTRKLGFIDVARVFCLSVFGWKFIRFAIVHPELSVRWYFRSRGKALTFEAGSLRIY